MIGGVGIVELVIIFSVLLILFGARRLPELGRSLGETIREFRGSVKELTRTLDEEDREVRRLTGDKR